MGQEWRRLALVVAIGEYAHPQLRRLRSTSFDAAALTDVLTDPDIGGFGVKLVEDPPHRDAKRAIEAFLARAAPDDLLLVHVACHGLQDEEGRLYFAATDTRPDALQSTAVSAAFVEQCVRTSASRQVVLLLDCCYSGAYAAGAQVRTGDEVNVLDSFPRRTGSAARVAVITASSSTEYAFAGATVTSRAPAGPGGFTSAVAAGLRTGDADLDGDGEVSLDDLYEYVYERITQANRAQRPRRVSELPGELLVARSPKAPDQEQGLGQLAEVLALRERVLGGDLVEAKAALETLRAFAATGAGGAGREGRRALDELADQQRSIAEDLGTVQRGQGPVTRVVPLGGPPLTRAVEIGPTPDWLQVQREDDELRLVATCDATGSYEARVALQTPVRRSVLHVQLMVVAPEPARSARDQEPIVWVRRPAPSRPAESPGGTDPPREPSATLPASPPPSLGHVQDGGPGLFGSPGFGQDLTHPTPAGPSRWRSGLAILAGLGVLVAVVAWLLTHAGAGSLVSVGMSAVVVGAIVGALGRLVVPGRQNVSVWLTIAIGTVAALVGSLVAGALGIGNTKGIDWIKLVIQVTLAALGVALASGGARSRSLR